MFHPSMSDVFDRLFIHPEFDFVRESQGEGLRWTISDHQKHFVIQLRWECAGLVLAWGWEDSTIHDAFCWSDKPGNGPTCQDCGGPHRPDEIPCPPTWVKTTEDQLYQLVASEVRRVAKFGRLNSRRQLEFAELHAVFIAVVGMWEGYLDNASVQLPDSLGWLAESKLALEYPDRQSCLLRLDSGQRFHLKREATCWRLLVEGCGPMAQPEVWQFVEEVGSDGSNQTIVHSSDLKSEILAALANASLI